MPSNHKTARLGLHDWLETDKPMRADFTADNQILDETLGGHLEDNTRHLTAADRGLLKNPVEVNDYIGNGAASRNLTFDFEPSAVFVFQMNKPIVEIVEGAVRCNAGFATSAIPGGGLILMNKALALTQTQGEAQNGIFYNLNASGAAYGCAAFR